MADETDNGTQTDAGAGNDSTLTLDSVYKEFNVDDMAANFRPSQPQQNMQQQDTRQAQNSAPADVPDPLLDANGFKAYQSRQAQIAQKHGDVLSQLTGTVAQMRAAEIRQNEERDIGAAVQKVKDAGFEADNDFIEIALGQKAKQDPRFLAVFNNRGKNPAAWNKALTAVANEMKGKFAFRTDENLASNVRAAKNSTQTTQSTAADTQGNSAEKHFSGIKDPRAFANEWERYVSNGY